MVVNYLMRPGLKMNIELRFRDAQLIKACGHCRVNGYVIKYQMGNRRGRIINTMVEDNGKRGGQLIEWFLN